jgi:transcriptional regulator with XRE-family HTH domain
MSLPNYLRVIRKSGSLSQAELAYLMRLAQSSVLKAELYQSVPNARVLISSVIIFDRDAREIFPKAFVDMEAKVLRQAKLLYQRLEATEDLEDRSKLQLLSALIRRLTDEKDA